jgi:cob(I)alamin adenosyltransferase
MKGIDMSRYKIYTKKGDDGTTGLLSGKRVSKHHVRIKAYGTAYEVSKLVNILEPIDEQAVKNLEDQIDMINDELPELKNFVIPGGHVVVSYAHLARCTCRRAERFVTELNEIENVPQIIIAYINRLSDFLFILSRKLTKDYQVKEIKWIAQKK